MKSFFVGLLFAAGLSVPLAALAQSPPPMGPPSQMRATMEQMRATAKTNAYNALTPDHRTQVQAIVAQVAAGTLDRRDASTKIDALLTPDEQKAVSTVEQKSFDDMRAAMAASGMAPPSGNGPPPGGPPPAAGPPNAPPPGADARPYGSMKNGPPSPGRFLLMVSLTREQMRGMHPQPAKSP